ncbi:hypothetical protein A8C32_18140 [Flavivirga aquatica]|uniref:DUF4142 domain-containing protein n=1 Tax=Flavivirga aquatica TaxID=1849968 RepID=A0A1E5T7S6_9FLAO|nr:hypothetical protein [Flavivirga aquatica]OEK07357.1 hypothetical protein A8C32_18140 [Flavivirga aquatica]
MKRYLVFLVIGFAFNFCSAQLPYFDPGAAIRELESRSVKKLKEESLKTTVAFGATATVAELEKLSRTRYLGVSTAVNIQYRKYESMCSSYLNPFKKQKCKNRYNYLKYAHRKVMGLLAIPTKHKVNVGVKEQIKQKYAHITNTILKELEALKLKAEKDNFYTRLIIK